MHVKKKRRSWLRTDRTRSGTTGFNQQNLLIRRGDAFPPTRKMAAPLLKSLAESLGSPEPAVRLILSLVIGKIRFVNQPVSHPGCCCYFCADNGIFDPGNFNSARRMGSLVGK